jgi:aminoglycoside/choline kinase family phosphotransferase
MAEPTTLAIPETPAALTPDWFTQALRLGGMLEEQRVVGVELQVLGEGVGFLGDLLRVSLTYDQPAGLPQSLIAKLPKLENRAMGELLGAYERENCFYMEMADRLPLATPKMYYGDFDRDQASEKQADILRAADRIPKFLSKPMTALARWIAANKNRRYILLLEDLHDGEMGDQLAGTSLVRCAGVMRAMAKAHAACWGEDFSGRFWLLPFDIDGHMRHGLFLGARAKFSEFFGPELEARLGPYLDTIARRGMAVVGELAAAPPTLLHFDLRLDNLCFRGDEVVVFDWQLVRYGPAAYDIAYFLSSALAEDAGRGQVMELLAAYHKALLEAGVRDYALNDLLRDYELALQLVLRTIPSIDQMELGEGRGVDLMRGWMGRLHARLAELQADDRLT